MQDEVARQIGLWLAAGWANEEIIEGLLEAGVEKREEALVLLKQIYDGWQQTTSSLNLKSDDLTNWHVHLRTNLLRKALADSSAAGVRAALAILDSLATIQRVVTSPIAEAQPLKIYLEAKKADA